MSVFIDTNILAYQYDASSPDKQARAREIFLANAAEAVISTQVMIELHAVLTRKLGRSRGDAERVLAALDVTVVPADTSLVRQAASTAAKYELSIFEAMILEAAVRASCTELLTEDLGDGSLLRGVRVVNPFEG